MSNRPRLTPSRFKVRDIVEISSSMHSQLSGRCARIVEIRENRYSQTLDKYVVLIEHSSEQKMLWDIESRAK